MSVCHTIKMTNLSVCQPHETPVHHLNIMTSPSVYVCHIKHLTIIPPPRQVCPYVNHVFHLSVIPSTQQVHLYVSQITHLSIIQVCPYARHMTHLSVILTSLSICQLQDS